MTTPEGKIEKYLVDRVRETGGKVRKLKWIGKNGAPDRMVWWPTSNALLRSAVFFVEVKAPGEKPTKQQSKEHKTMMDDGLNVWVLDSEKKVELFVRNSAHPDLYVV